MLSVRNIDTLFVAICLFLWSSNIFRVWISFGVSRVCVCVCVCVCVPARAHRLCPPTSSQTRGPASLMPVPVFSWTTRLSSWLPGECTDLACAFHRRERERERERDRGNCRKVKGINNGTRLFRLPLPSCSSLLPFFVSNLTVVGHNRKAFIILLATWQFCLYDLLFVQVRQRVGLQQPCCGLSELHDRAGGGWFLNQCPPACFPKHDFFFLVPSVWLTAPCDFF